MSAKRVATPSWESGRNIPKDIGRLSGQSWETKSLHIGSAGHRICTVVVDETVGSSTHQRASQ